MLTIRPRRNRKSPAIRSLVEETRLHTSDLIYPLFLTEAESSPIASLPGIFRFNLSDLLKEIEGALRLNIQSVALFPIIQPEMKDPFGKEALNPDGFHQEAIRTIKQEFPQLCLICDVALDPYTTHGHDGVVDEHGLVLNDETVAILAQMAAVQAEAGADMVAPSDMMDGRVGAIRRALDDSGYPNVSIHAYSAKYASAFYGPFRDALGSSPRGDKKSYQMNPANRREALLEAQIDEKEGADILMVKPAIHYLDVICKLKEVSQLPISAYHTSGELAMIFAAAERGWLDKEKALWEATLSIKRAGADMIFTYAAPQIAKMISR